MPWFSVIYKSYFFENNLESLQVMVLQKICDLVNFKQYKDVVDAKEKLKATKDVLANLLVDLEKQSQHILCFTTN
jgi:hypothetical protein